MAYNDEPEYYDDDDIEYYDDDEDYIDYSDEYDDEADDDEELGGRRSSASGSIRPFGSGGSVSPFGSGSGSSGSSRFSGGSRTNRDDLRSRLTSAGDGSSSGSSGSSRFSSSRFSGGSSSAGSSGSSSGASRLNRSSSGSDDDSSSGSSRFSSSRFSGGSTSSGSSSSSSGTSRFSGGSSPSGSSGSSSGSSRFSGGSSSSRASSSGSGTSRFNRSSSSPSSGSDDKSGGSGSSRFSSSRFSGGSKTNEKDKPAAKKDKAAEKKAADSGSGGFAGRLGGLRNAIGGSDDSKDGDKKSDDSGGGLAGALGGLRNALPIGGSDDSKDSGKKSNDSGGGLAGRLGGLRNALPIGGSDDSKDSDKKSDDSGGGGLAGRLGGLRNALPIGGSSDSGDDKQAKASGSASPFSKRSTSAKKDDKKATSKKDSAAKTSAKGGKQSPLAKARASGKKDSGSKKATKGAKTAAATTADAAGPLAGLTATIGGIFGGGQKASGKSSKSRAKAASKVPTATEDGLTLDNWLDILGVACVFFSLVLFFSAISAEQAVISAVHNVLGELFGWGAAAAPIALFVVGMWLIVRHFGDDAPTIDPVRIAGVLVAFVSMLVIFQYIDSFNVERYGVTMTYEQLRFQLRIAWDVYQSGGGRIGAELYYFLLTTVTEIGGFLLVLFTLLVGMMLALRLSASEIALFFVGLWRNTRDGMAQRAQERRAKRQLATQKAAEIAAQRAQERAAAAEVVEAAPQPVAQMVAATAAAGAVGSDIRFNFGGQVQNAPTNQPVATVPVPQSRPPQQSSGGGFLSRFRGGNNSPTTAQPQPPPLVNPLPLDDGTILPPGQGYPPQPATMPAMPQQPAAQAESTPSIGELMRGPEAPQAAPAQPKTADAASEEDPVAARIERLNALRRGEIGELSQSAMARARKDDLDAAFVPESEGKREARYSAFGKPDDIPTHSSENIPYSNDGQSTIRPSQLPSVQPDGDSGPRQQPLSVPVSSPIQRAGRARPQWQLPDYRTLLSAGGEQEFDRELLLKQAKTIEDTLAGFGAPGRVVEVNTGPVVTQFGVEPDYLTGRNGRKQRVKVSAIASLDRDLQLALGARSIRVEAPVPGKGYVGVEIPNAEPSLVGLRDVMESAGFQKVKSPLAIALGQSVSGAPISADLASMPHVLIAGTTGSGKSVCVNSIIASILSTNTPEQVKFIMVDPKRVELTGYNGIPHLVAPVVVELERIVGVLKWVTREMDERYKKFSEAGARNIEDYNGHIDPNIEEPMPYIVVIIDELADLMMLAPEETERTITRIAALARATGIHLVIATQRPSVDVVTGLIKANFPARVAFAVAGSVDSRVILDQPGAERLLGKGDMLYLSGSSPAPLRMQGVFVSDMEITNLVRYWKMQAVQQPKSDNLMTKPRFGQADRTAVPDTPVRQMGRQQAFWDSDEPLPSFATGGSGNSADDAEEDVELTQRELTGDVKDGNEDELYDKAVELVRRLDKASISLLQRRLRIGYTRAARLIDVMEARGVVGPAKEGSSKPRDVLPA